MPPTASRETAVVPAVAQPHSFACLRSFGKRDVRTLAACEEPATPAFWSRYCDETVVVPSPGDDLIEYKDALLDLARRPDVRTIVPMREADTYVLSKFESEFEDHLAPLWPDFETLRTVHDRVRLVEAAERAGVSAPETHRIDEVERWDRRRIVKARFALLTDEYVTSGSPKDTFHPPTDPAPTEYVSKNEVYFVEAGAEPDLETIRAEMGHTPIAQEYVPGGEYALWALYDRGEPVATCQKKQIRARSHAGGTSVYRETTDRPKLEAAGRALLDHLDWHGFASVQFKEDANTGEFTLMEINPRVWISVSCPVRAGVDFPYYYWLLSQGKRVRVRSEYEVGIGTHNLLGEAMYLRSILRDDNPFVEPPSLAAGLWAIASSLYGQPHCEYVDLDDPGPLGRVAIGRLPWRTSVSVGSERPLP